METNFNFKSQVCTSIEQSSRLLGLGLKKETADCYWFYCDIAKEWKCTILSSPQVFKDYPTTVIPAWSLHRLIKILGVQIIEIWSDVDAYEELIYMIQIRVEMGFLEDKYLEG